MAKIAGLGIDVEEPGRFKMHLPEGQVIPGLIRSIFTEAEIHHNRQAHPELTFPLGFSCKEAFFKAFGVSWTNSPITWHDIEMIFTDPSDLNKHLIRLSNYAEELFAKMNCIRYETSFEIHEDHVVFEVLLITE